MFLRSGEKLFIPIFTSEENAMLYRDRGSLDCLIACLATAQDVASYIESPPSRAPGLHHDFDIMCDPIDSSNVDHMTIPRESFWAAFRAAADSE